LTVLARLQLILPDSSSLHNHGSGKWLYCTGNYYFRDPFFTFMIVGGIHGHREQVASTSYSSLRMKFMERKLALGNIFLILGTYKH